VPHASLRQRLFFPSRKKDRGAEGCRQSSCGPGCIQQSLTNAMWEDIRVRGKFERHQHRLLVSRHDGTLGAPARVPESRCSMRPSAIGCTNGCFDGKREMRREQNGSASEEQKICSFATETAKPIIVRGSLHFPEQATLTQATSQLGSTLAVRDEASLHLYCWKASGTRSNPTSP
jgi:hypothetical protein